MLSESSLQSQFPADQDTLPDLPDGFRELGQVILTGDLHDGQQLQAACEHLWQGINI